MLIRLDSRKPVDFPNWYLFKIQSLYIFSIFAQLNACCYPWQKSVSAPDRCSRRKCRHKKNKHMKPNKCNENTSDHYSRSAPIEISQKSKILRTYVIANEIQLASSADWLSTVEYSCWTELVRKTKMAPSKGKNTRRTDVSCARWRLCPWERAQANICATFLGFQMRRCERNCWKISRKRWMKYFSSIAGLTPRE